MEYNHQDIEKRWQQYWRDNNIYKVDVDSSRPKFYVLDMFPYPSGAGLHVGHPLGYIASDIAYIVNDAAMTAAFTDQPISEAILETAVGNTRPSLRRETLRTFEDIRDRMEGIERSNIRRPIGFTV